MTLDEFRRHPAYDYYIRTLVSNCLICELVVLLIQFLNVKDNG